MVITLDKIKGSGPLWVELATIICNPLIGESMCDLGSHHAPYTPLLGYTEYIYVDIQDRGLDNKELEKWFIKSDAIEYLQKCNRKFDLCIASDFLEHLTEDKGNKFLCLMQEHSDKQVIFTPLGPWMITEEDNPDGHRSGWTPEMLPEYLSIVLPDFHPALGIGAFFAVNCSDEEKQRIYNEIKNKYVREDQTH